MDSTVGILLCTFNGGAHLADQLHSIGQQTYARWQLAASDDGSTDETLTLLESSRRQFGERIVLISGPRQGFARNFLSLVQTPPMAADHWAFCDQDDIWESDKLSRAVAWLSAVPPEVPALYCSRSILVDAHGHRIGVSPLWKKPPGFRNALVQNIASGNTMVFNESARQLLAEAGGPDTAFHDWLLYLSVTGAGGVVQFDSRPSIFYRQHGSNVLGPWGDRRSQWLRMKLLFDGTFGAWIDKNMTDLIRIDARLELEAKHVAASFRARNSSPLRIRSRLLQELGIYHQSQMGNLALTLAMHMNRV